MFVILFIGMLLEFADFWNGNWKFSNQLERNSVGEGDYTEEMEISSKYFSGEYTVQVEEEQLKKKDAKKIINRAKAEIDKTFLGENEDLAHVVNDVRVLSSYQDGLVKAKWNFDDYQAIHSDGIIQKEEIEKPHIVNAMVELSCQQYQQIYEFTFQIVPAPKNSKEGFLLALAKNLQEQKRDNKALLLPTKINGETIRWKKKNTHRGFSICLLCLFACIAIPFAKKWEEKKRQEEKKKEQLQDYPTIVGQLTLLLGVGISFPEAAERIADRYEKKKCLAGQTRAGYELVCQLQRQMAGGMSEYQAIGVFGKRAGNVEYRRLALLLQQNQQKGNEQLLALLEKENVEAFEMRKNMAKKAGDEASTKLLIPMMGMLGIILVILIMPAFVMLGGV